MAEQTLVQVDFTGNRGAGKTALRNLLCQALEASNLPPPVIYGADGTREWMVVDTTQMLRSVAEDAKADSDSQTGGAAA